MNQMQLRQPANNQWKGQYGQVNQQNVDWNRPASQWGANNPTAWQQQQLPPQPHAQQWGGAAVINTSATPPWQQAPPQQQWGGAPMNTGPINGASSWQRNQEQQYHGGANRPPNAAQAPRVKVKRKRKVKVVEEDAGGFCM